MLCYLLGITKMDDNPLLPKVVMHYSYLKLKSFEVSAE